MPNIESLLKQRLNARRVKILSPFDNLVIQRKRIKNFFDFDYQIECYVPESKRKYGYFSLPLLWGKQFVGRMDVKIDRKLGVLNIKHLHIETDKTDQLITALKKSLHQFLVFNAGQSIKIQKISHINQKLSAAKIKGCLNVS
ncbi:MAG: crosslink repair DNA glycosylase YcaQ family protein [Enterobacterales bacterium]|nr:crosslink repair DNA glycosylase YcaQ family protein [Enterobacterales bacterium]